jgi:hypothetical protein
VYTHFENLNEGIKLKQKKLQTDCLQLNNYGLLYCLVPIVINIKATELKSKNSKVKKANQQF